MFLINGKPGNNIPVEDRGLHYGDGVFTTIAVTEGVPLCLDRHLNRLQDNCKSLNFPDPDTALLKNEINLVCNQVNKGVLKIILTRGSGGRGYVIPHPTNITRIIADYPWPDHPDNYVIDGIRLFLCKTRIGTSPALAGIKHLNRLEQIITRNEWKDTDYAEGLVMNEDGQVIEGTMSNFFIIKDSMLFTPDLSGAGIKGITRDLIIENAAEFGMETHVTTITLDEIFNADEIFLCNSIIGIWPVREFNNKSYHPRHKTEEIRSFLLVNNFIIE